MLERAEKAVAVIKGIGFKIKANQVGVLARVRGKCRIRNKGNLQIGKSFSVYGRPIPTSITTENKKASISIGDNVFINYGVDIGCAKSIRIGDFVKIGQLTHIIDSNYHQIDYDDVNSGREIIIEKNVWIGSRCTILPGVTIGENSVIASGSVVTKDIPDNVLVAGSPAVVIKELNIPEGWIRK